MGGQLGYGELLAKQFTPQKLLFHFLFWGFHWGIFAYGWSVND
jgi:NADPH oxidase